jgi:hypothetical protein
MVNLVNPQVYIKVPDFDFDTEEFAVQPRVSFRVEKDLQDHPNEAEVTIYNLNRDWQSRLRDAGENDAPIEIHMSTGGRADDGTIQVYKGEIDYSRSMQLRPGFETKITAFSQKKNHRSFWFEKTYARDTPTDEIVFEMAEAIGLPYGNSFDIPTTGILLSESFSGPAFEILARYCFDMGLYTYILDGKLYITSIFEPPEPTVITLEDAILLSEPQQKIRHDRTEVEMRAIIEASNKSPFPPKRRRKKRKKKKIDIVGKNDYVKFEAVDEAIKGMDFLLLAQPSIQPDNIVKFDGVYYRVQELYHYGNNDGTEWNTELYTDEYVEDGGNFLADVSGSEGGGDFLIL